MQIITLTSDLGLKDYYVASIKGALLSKIKNIELVDISHEVRAFNIAEAAYLLSNCLDDFPENTIHLVGIDCEPMIHPQTGLYSNLPSVLKFKNQYIVSSDNGIFSLLVKEESHQGFWQISQLYKDSHQLNFPIKNILVPIIEKLVQSKDLDKYAEQKEGFVRRVTQIPVVEPNLIIGSVQHIDNYGNIITNIDKNLFEQIGKKEPFTIFFRKKEYYIDMLHTSYGDVPGGEKVAFFNSSMLLEIAINRSATTLHGGANALFGMHVGDSIRIEFSPKGSKETIESLF